MQGRSNFENPVVALEGLAFGDAGTARTLEIMTQAVRGELAPDYAGWRDERIGSLALGVGEVGMQAESVVGATFTFVRDAIPYYPDNELCELRGVECGDLQIVQDAPTTLGWRDGIAAGKCVDKCVLLACLLRNLGYVSRFVVQRHRQRDGTEDFDHVYLEYWDGGEWVALDPTGDGKNGRKLAAMGWRQPALEESTYEIFGGGEMDGLNGLGDFDAQQTINNAIAAIGSIFGGGNYADPQIGYYPTDQYGRPYPPGYYPQQYSGAYTPATLTQGGIQVNTWTLVLGGILVGAVLFGRWTRR